MLSSINSLFEEISKQFEKKINSLFNLFLTMLSKKRSEIISSILKKMRNPNPLQANFSDREIAFLKKILVVESNLLDSYTLR